MFQQRPYHCLTHSEGDGFSEVGGWITPISDCFLSISLLTLEPSGRIASFVDIGDIGAEFVCFITFVITFVLAAFSTAFNFLLLIWGIDSWFDRFDAFGMLRISVIFWLSAPELDTIDVALQQWDGIFVYLHEDQINRRRRFINLVNICNLFTFQSIRHYPLLHQSV